jgi:hypothetical protein
MRCLTEITVYGGTSLSDGTRVATKVLSWSADVAACAPGQYAALTVAELDLHAQGPFNLSLADAGSIASAVVLVWALGFGIRMVIRALRSDQTIFEGE